MFQHKGQKKEEHSEVKDLDQQAFQKVSFLVVTNFVGHHSYEFWDRVVIDERVEQANSFVAAESGKKSIGL